MPLPFTNFELLAADIESKWKTMHSQHFEQWDTTLNAEANAKRVKRKSAAKAAASARVALGYVIL